MTKKDQFRAIRRTFRLACKISPLAHENAVVLYMAAVSSLRNFTGKWDCCEAIRLGQQREQSKKYKDHYYRPLHVAAACTRWLRAH